MYRGSYWSGLQAGVDPLAIVWKLLVYWIIIVYFITGNVLFFLFGASLTWSSPVLPKLQDEKETPFTSIPSQEEISWISSIMLLGATFGGYIFGFMASHLGRRPAILSMGPLLIFSYLAMAFCETVDCYYVCRFIIGIVSGGCISLGMVYIGEQTNKSNRAAMFAIAGIGINSGGLFSYAVGPYITVRLFNILWSVFAACFLVLFFVLGKETAHYFMMQNRESEARVALSAIRSSKDDIDEELAEIKNKIHEQNQGSLGEMLKKRHVVKAFYIGMCIITLQQLSGINTILFYGQKIFEMSGSTMDSKISSIITGLAQVFGSLICIFTAERFNRKTMVIASAIGMISGLVPLGTYCYLNDHHTNLDSLSFLPVLSLVLVTMSFNNGVGPTPMTIVAEIFPVRIKELGISITTSIFFIIPFFLTKYFDSLTDFLGLGQFFFLYSGFLTLLIVFVIFFVIETKGKTLEEIQDCLSR